MNRNRRRHKPMSNIVDIAVNTDEMLNTFNDAIKQESIALLAGRQGGKSATFLKYPLTPDQCYRIAAKARDISRELQPGEYKSYVAYKDKDLEPKRTEFGLGYFEDEIGGYFISGELTLSMYGTPGNTDKLKDIESVFRDPYTVDFKEEMGIRIVNPFINSSKT